MSSPLSSSTHMSPQIPQSALAVGRIQPLLSWRRHLWLMILIVLASGLVGLAAALNAPEPYYVSRAVILVSPTSETNLENEESLRGQDYARYVNQQQYLLTRNDVLQETLQDPDIKAAWYQVDAETGELESDKKALRRFRNALKTKSKARAHPFINVSLRKDTLEGIDEVLNRLLDVYLRYSRQDNNYDSDGRIEELRNAINSFQEQIEQHRKKRLDIAGELGVTTFQQDTLNPYDSILVEMETAYKQARRELIQAQAQLDTLLDGSRGTGTLDALIQARLVADTSGLEDKIYTELQNVSVQLLGMTPANPSYQRLQRHQQKLSADLQDLEQRQYRDIREQIIGQQRAAVAQAKQIEQALGDEISRQRQESTRYANLYSEGLDLNKDIERAFRQIDRLNQRIESLLIESSAPGFVRLYSHANLPNFAEGGGSKKILFLAVIAGVFIAIALPIGIDLLDKRIQTPSEITKVVGFPPVIWVLDRQGNYYEQLILDQLRRLAMALRRDWQNHQSRCFAITSVKPAGGSTTLVLELARRLDELGLRTITVELNAFKPDPRYRDPTDKNPQGLAYLLRQPINSPVMVEQLISPATNDLPARLPIGVNPDRHLRTFGRLREVLDYLNQQYDMVLLDTPPVLLSADAELLGEIQAGVLLVVESGQIYPGELRRATGLLERLNPPVVAAIMNRIKIFDGGYVTTLLEEYSTGTKAKLPLWKRLLWRT